MPCPLRKSALILLIQLVVVSLYSQKYANNWVVGMKAGINFNFNPPQTFSGTTTGSYGTSTWSDSNGNLLFYTDGSSVYNSSHTIIPNGSGMNMKSTQSVIIPLPGSQSIFYIFANSGSNPDFKYSVVVLYK